jgi:hypothetical protein
MAGCQPMVKRLDDGSSTLFSFERPVAWSWLEPVKQQRVLGFMLPYWRESRWPGKERKKKDVRTHWTATDHGWRMASLLGWAGAAADGKHTLTA